jgi:DNA polymerase I-like protein with 3'-5' exonuclease and polymerase domains
MQISQNWPWIGIPQAQALQCQAHQCVHYELVFEVPKDDTEEAASIIKDEMDAAGREYLTSVPVVVEINAGEAWEK